MKDPYAVIGFSVILFISVAVGVVAEVQYDKPFWVAFPLSLFLISGAVLVNGLIAMIEDGCQVVSTIRMGEPLPWIQRLRSAFWLVLVLLLMTAIAIGVSHRLGFW